MKIEKPHATGGILVCAIARRVVFRNAAMFGRLFLSRSQSADRTELGRAGSGVKEALQDLQCIETVSEWENRPMDCGVPTWAALSSPAGQKSSMFFLSRSSSSKPGIEFGTGVSKKLEKLLDVRTDSELE